MREARLIETTEIDVTEIDASNRLRPISTNALDALVNSIETLGRLTDPIHVRKTKAGIILIAGAHRLAAVKRLGWSTITATLWDCSKDWADLLEVDDNLAHSELSAIELAIFLSKRKAIYETLFPTARRGVSGGLARHNSANEIVSFAESVASKRKIGVRQVQNYIAIGENLTPDEQTRLLAIDPTQADLLAFAKLFDRQDRAAVLDAVENGETETIKSVLKSQKPTPRVSDEERALNALNEAFNRASKRVKDKFLEFNGLTRIAGDE